RARIERKSIRTEFTKIYPIDTPSNSPKFRRSGKSPDEKSDSKVSGYEPLTGGKELLTSTFDQITP
ncbi:hypothetical protein N8646_01360, partial [bacterium]|nr:hypothetical protein [bacterium]